MVAPVGNHRPVPAQKPPATEEPAAANRGKSADSVGHMAKAMIAEKLDGADLPSNIRGKVASMIARNAVDLSPWVTTEAAPDPAVTGGGTETAPTETAEAEAGPVTSEPEPEKDAPGGETAFLFLAASYSEFNADLELVEDLTPDGE